MKQLVFCLLAVLLVLSGCGYDPDEPAYDTARNPNQFPPAAVSLVDRLQTGELTGMDAIAEAFGQVYTDHSTLLDNRQWLDVIERLGAKFGYRAGQLRDSGIPCYCQAAEYYQLAAFACPSDVRLQHQAALFGTWLNGIQRGSIDSALLPASAPELEQVLAATRYYVLTDSLHREFFDINLRSQWQDRLRAAGQLSPSVLQRLSAVDRTCLTFAGFDIGPVTGKLATFLNPKVDLVAAEIRRVAPDHYAIEAYLIPHEPVAGDITMAVRLVAADADSARPDFNQSARFSQMDVVPLTPAATWQPGRIAAVAAGIGYSAVIKSAALGLVERRNGGPASLGIEGRADELVPLDSTHLVLQ